jgi:ABC-type transport system involved in cytochrome c biogenesis permease component
MVCYLLTIVLLRRGIPAVKVKSGKSVGRVRAKKQRELGSASRLVMRYLGKGEIEDGRNPVFVRELRWGLVGRAHTLIVSFLVSLVIPTLMASLGAFRDGGVEAVYVWLATHMAITLVLAPSVLTTSFTKEFEDGNFEMLRITPLRPREVVMGKIKAGMASLAPLFLGGLLWAAGLSVLIPESIPALLGGFVTLFICCVLCMSISVFASIRCRRSSTASMVSYALAAFFVLGFLAYPLSPIFGFVAFVGLVHEGNPISAALWWGFTLLISMAIAAVFIGGTIAGYRRKMTDD